MLRQRVSAREARHGNWNLLRADANDVDGELSVNVWTQREESERGGSEKPPQFVEMIGQQVGSPLQFVRALAWLAGSNQNEW